MADDNGFTFVDKRRTVIASHEVMDSSEPIATDDVLQGDEAGPDTDTDGTDEAGSAAAQAPDVYMLVTYALQMFVTTAWQRLGLWADPASGEVEADLDQAKAAIDVVGDLVARLEGAPESSVSERDVRELKRILNDLRMNYVSRRAQG